MFEFLEFEISRHKVEAGKRGPADNLRKRTLRFVVSNCAVEVSLSATSNSGWQPNRDERDALRVKINGEGAEASHRKILREVSGRGRFSRPAFEVRHRKNLEPFPHGSNRQVAWLGFRKERTDLMDLRKGVQAPSRDPLQVWPLPANDNWRR